MTKSISGTTAAIGINICKFSRKGAPPASLPRNRVAFANTRLVDPSSDRRQPSPHFSQVFTSVMLAITIEKEYKGPPVHRTPMFQISENALEWALKHITKFYSSDFFPAPFEFEAISYDWPTVKTHLRALDLEKHVPSTPVTLLAPKPNGTFRAVHQLTPLDSLLYAALIFEIAADVEKFRVPAASAIVFSYRIKPDVDGSFFASEQGWDQFVMRTEALAQRHRNGFVITCDFVDFYNQIYTHRIRNLIAEAGGRRLEPHSKVVEHFLHGLNTQTSRGIPVGPASSVVLAELIMADIDKKILTYTSAFVRWADDIRIFAATREEAERILHDLTEFVHANHRLVFSGEKTRIISVKGFAEKQAANAIDEEKLVGTKAEEIALKTYYEELMENLGPYDDPEDKFDSDAFAAVLEDVAKTERFALLSNVYAELLSAELEKQFPELSLLRRILRNASRYRIRSILPTVLSNFERLVPVVREVVIYLQKIIDNKVVKKNAKAFRKIASSPRMQIPYINMWIAALLQNDAFNAVGLPENYQSIRQLRDQALIARRRQDATWIKGYKNGLDVLGPWEKRAVMYAATVLSEDELVHWLRIVRARGDVTDSAVAKFAIAQKKAEK